MDEKEKLEMCLAELEQDVAKKRDKEREFLASMEELVESFSRKEARDKARIDALIAEKDQLASVIKQKDRETEMLQAQDNAMNALRLACEERVQLLMDHLVNLLSRGTQGEGNEKVLAEVMQDAQDRQIANEDRLHVFTAQLHEARQDNKLLAQKLTQIFACTTSVHDQLCERQKELFNGERPKPLPLQQQQQTVAWSSMVDQEEPSPAVEEKGSFTSVLQAWTAQENHHIDRGLDQTPRTPKETQVTLVSTPGAETCRWGSPVLAQHAQAAEVANLPSPGSAACHSHQNGILAEETTTAESPEARSWTVSGSEDEAARAKQAYNHWKQNASQHANELRLRLSKVPPAAMDAGEPYLNVDLLEKKLREALITVSFEKQVVRVANRNGSYRFGSDTTAVISFGPNGQLLAWRDPAENTGEAPEPILAFLRSFSSSTLVSTGNSQCSTARTPQSGAPGEASSPGSSRQSPRNSYVPRRTSGSGVDSAPQPQGQVVAAVAAPEGFSGAASAPTARPSRLQHTSPRALLAAVQPARGAASGARLRDGRGGGGAGSINMVDSRPVPGVAGALPITQQQAVAANSWTASGASAIGAGHRNAMNAVRRVSPPPQLSQPKPVMVRTTSRSPVRGVNATALANSADRATASPLRTASAPPLSSGRTSSCSEPLGPVSYSATGADFCAQSAPRRSCSPPNNVAQLAHMHAAPLRSPWPSGPPMVMCR
eukprot:CAMPEP_0178409382 /NCGR_PEP_ID=MMETSP0689_2-20121128/20433_1 /TAXON_ID=160604 /ORGANISM="Amphidinium massartii, Strain CS-259" /LENGTH=716 /DNA_ID=CAMNT_0020030521 /DNA_START=39 /DNA_END=2185 /DNA_ORIENTATION=-